MKTIIDNNTRTELIERINKLSENNIAQWGKMNVYQMLKHCLKWNYMIVGKIKVKPMFLGKIFGKIALNKVLKNDLPLRKNSPTSPELIISEKEGDINLQKKELIKSVNEFGNFNTPNFVHPFFGKMTKEQVGQFVFKHHDHHLRQFGV